MGAGAADDVQRNASVERVAVAAPAQRRDDAPDADRSGFYRVNYDAENWRRLVRQLSADHSVLAPSMRLRLLDDAFSLGHAGIIGYGTAFRLAEYLTSGVDPFILRIVRRHLQLIQHLAGADSLESSLPDAYPILVRDSSSF